MTAERSLQLALDAKPIRVHAQLPDAPLRSDTQDLRLIARIPFILRREKHRSREEKAPSRSGFPASMYVVLKTRHVNPNIHARRFIVHVRSLNLSATRPQLYIHTRSNNLI